MSSQIPTRRPTRVTRPTNDENAPSRIGALQRTTKQTIPVDNLVKNNAKDASGPLKPTAASSRPRTALAQQDKTVLNTSSIAGKRKRDALGDATNGKAKAATTAAINSKITGLGGGVASAAAKASMANQRASSVSTNVSNTTKENAATGSTATTRTRAPLGVKSKNVAGVASVVSEKEKRTEVTTKEVVARRPLVAKAASRPASVARDVTVSKTRKVTHTTVHQETKTQQVIRQAHGQKISTITKVEDLDVEEVDEDELRSHKRPRLSDEVEEELIEAKELGNITVEEVKEMLSIKVAKAEDEQPDDLDKDDADDPLMVAEYVVEIFDYLRHLEKTTMPHPNYMEAQKQLKPHMRGILGEWIIGIHRSLRMVPETLFIAMNLIDRFLSVRAISLEKVQLVGVVCLLIASKYEEICAPSIAMMLRFSAKSSTVDEIKEAEKYVLKSVKYNLSYSSPITFLRRVSKADGFDAESRTVAKYLVELFCVEYELVQFPPSCISAAAMWLARLALDRGEWTANLAHYSGYKEAELLPAANIMLNHILKRPQYASIFEKYASKKFNKASILMRSWALARWDENCDVDLNECLAALMEDSRLRVLSGRAGVIELLEAPVFAEEVSK